MRTNVLELFAARTEDGGYVVRAVTTTGPVTLYLSWQQGHDLVGGLTCELAPTPEVEEE